jgi:hypothetical protein
VKLLNTLLVKNRLTYNIEILDKFCDPRISEEKLSVPVIYGHISNYTTILTFGRRVIFIIHTGRGDAGDCEVHAALNLIRHASFHICNPI